MTWPPNRDGVPDSTPIPNPFNSPQNNSSNTIAQIDPVPLVCSAQRRAGAYHFAPIVQARWFVRFLRILQWPFAWGFWLLEQKIAALELEIERRRS